MLDTDVMPARIESWLDTEGNPGTVTSYEIMVGGFSRVMAKVAIRFADGEEWTGVLRGDPPPELATLESDRDAEWSLLSDLSVVEAIPTPRARWYVSDPEVFGTKAIWIDFVEGGSLQASLDAGADLDEVIDKMFALSGAISSVEPGQLPDVACPESWDAHLDSMIGRWRSVAVDHIESAPIVRYIASWLDRRRPEPLPLRLVHGDFQAGNVVAGPDGWQVVDWEFARIGDPREDLGYYNAYCGAVPPNLFDHDMDRALSVYRAATGFTEEHVNPLTLGYFTVLSTISTIMGLYEGAAAFARGERRGVGVAYNANLIPVGSSNFIDAIDGLEAAFAAAKEA